MKTVMMPMLALVCLIGCDLSRAQRDDASKSDKRAVGEEQSKHGRASGGERHSATSVVRFTPGTAVALPKPVFDLETVPLDPTVLGKCNVALREINNVRVLVFGSNSAPVYIKADGIPTGSMQRTILGVCRLSETGRVSLVEYGCLGAIATWTILHVDYLSFYGCDMSVREMAQPYEWCIRAFTYSGSNVSFYVNGNLSGSATITLRTIGTALAIGTRNTQGIIRGLKIWNEALTPAQMKQATQEALDSARDFM